MFDLGGRRVRGLLEKGVLPAGVHAVTWDGRDQEGQIVPAGLHLCRLEVCGRSATQKLLRLP